jgi:hypothetical protein
MKTDVNCGLQLLVVYSDFIVTPNVQLFLTKARQVGQHSIGAMSLWIKLRWSMPQLTLYPSLEVDSGHLDTLFWWNVVRYGGNRRKRPYFHLPVDEKQHVLMTTAALHHLYDWWEAVFNDCCGSIVLVVLALYVISPMMKRRIKCRVRCWRVWDACAFPYSVHVFSVCVMHKTSRTEEQTQVLSARLTSITINQKQ